jgi:hypothetical protein
VVDTSTGNYSSLPINTTVTELRFWTAATMGSKIYFFPEGETSISVMQLPPTPTSWQSRFLFWLWITRYLQSMGGMIGF